MNKKILVLLATCTMVATSLPFTGCAASKNQNAKTLPTTGTTVIAATMENEEAPKETQKRVTGMKLESAGNSTTDLMKVKPDDVSAALLDIGATKKANERLAKKNAKKNAKRKAFFIFI